MNLIETQYHPKFEIHFSEPEVAEMMACSERHYDALCRSLGQSGGMIMGFHNRITFVPDEPCHVVLDRSQIDILCKVLEDSSDKQLFRSLCKLLDVKSIVPLKMWTGVGQ